MLLHSDTWSVANLIDDVLAALPAPVAARASAETHACVVEPKTGSHAIVADAAAELAVLREGLDDARPRPPRAHDGVTCARDGRTGARRPAGRPASAAGARRQLALLARPRLRVASMRTPIFSMFPRVGIPRHFGRYASYVRAVGLMVRSGAVPDPRFLWWDARLQPRLGTSAEFVPAARAAVAA